MPGQGTRGVGDEATSGLRRVGPVVAPAALRRAEARAERGRVMQEGLERLAQREIVALTDAVPVRVEGVDPVRGQTDRAPGPDRGQTSPLQVTDGHRDCLLGQAGARRQEPGGDVFGADDPQDVAASGSETAAARSDSTVRAVRACPSSATRGRSASVVPFPTTWVKNPSEGLTSGGDHGIPTPGRLS